MSAGESLRALSASVRKGERSAVETVEAALAENRGRRTAPSTPSPL